MEEGGNPLTAQEDVVDGYRSLQSADGSKYAPLQKVELRQELDDATLDLYIRIRQGLGTQPFFSAYLANDSDKRRFQSRSVDTCLFITTADSLFAVTSGSGHHILTDYADYAFPFDVAKKLFANNFRATDIRSIAGATTSRTETYRRMQSIGTSDSFGKVWKRLVSRLNTKLLPDDSYFLKLVDPSRPPTIEIKSSFALKKSLDLRQLVLVAKELESLPEPSDEQRRQLSFLDNLYQVRSTTDKAELAELLVERVRRALTDGEAMDLDVCDPDDVARYYAGSNFKISYRPIDGEPPDADDVLDAVKIACADVLEDPAAFHRRFNSLRMSYTVDPASDSEFIARDLIKFMHGQVDRDGQAYFLLDRLWYRVQGEFLDNLKRDFIQEVFDGTDPIFMGNELSFRNWHRVDEAGFNEAQAKVADYYYGDKIFAVSDMGKVELFDLLKVDLAARRLYVIHVKDGFDAKLRDACSQIQMSAEVITQDIKDRKEVLKKYYVDWRKHEINRRKRIDETTFLNWFDLSITYIVLVSTRRTFTALTFQRDLLMSHIARRETLATFNEFRGRGNVFRLAHTPRS
jgi:uncharacterized protein (TIGR04141 family)